MPDTLFVLGSRKPTTRDIANAIKKGGAEAALAGADHRADEADYQEVTCRSALNRVQGMPFNWTLNPYRGCTHGCHYCFARRYHSQFEMNSSDDFASKILVKVNLIDVLARELDRPSWKRERVAFGTATDPYQPIEGHYKLTRRALEVLARGKTPVGLITKGPMVVRDKDVLADLTRAAGCTVYVSVPSVDEDAWRTLEPGVAPPIQRLRAVRELVDAGIHAGVLMAPIVPGFTSSRRKVEDTIKAIADHGARFVGAAVMRLEDGTRDHFFGFIEQHFPSMLPGLTRLYGRKEAPPAYRHEVQAMVRVLQERYGLSTRDEGARRLQPSGAAPAPSEEDAATPPRQTAFGW
ncbi:MAG TPA: radical SAM protein [Vicinamibacterales bacterium]|nr:radical SAM protein [Vicinamibacterales bacterium]